MIGTREPLLQTMIIIAVIFVQRKHKSMIFNLISFVINRLISFWAELYLNYQIWGSIVNNQLKLWIENKKKKAICNQVAERGDRLRERYGLNTPPTCIIYSVTTSGGSNTGREEALFRLTASIWVEAVCKWLDRIGGMMGFKLSSLSIDLWRFGRTDDQNRHGHFSYSLSEMWRISGGTKPIRNKKIPWLYHV